MTMPAASAAQAQTCDQGVIARVDVVNHSIFAPEDIAGRRNEWVYGAVNRAHIRTREGFLRRQVLVKAGDCYDPLLVSDSGRLVRELSFLARAEESAARQPDGAWIVRFETWDEWTTLISFNASVEDKFEFEGARLEENNFLGRGGKAFLEVNRYRERRDLRLLLLTRRFLGSLAESWLVLGKTRNGSIFEAKVDHPFRGETDGFSYDAYVTQWDRDRSYYTGDRRGVSHLLVPVTRRKLEGRLAWRFGEVGNRSSVRFHLDIGRPQADGPPRIALESEYDELVPAPDSLTLNLNRQTVLQSFARVGFSGGLRRVRFETRTGLDLVFGTQDVAIGTEFEITVGRTLATWGTRELGSFAAAEFFASGANRWLVAQTQIRAEGHLLDHAAETQSRTREVMAAGHAVAYFQPSSLENHTLIARVAYQGAWRFDDFQQLSLGGGDWVRSLVDFEAPVSKRFVARLEERFRIPGLPPALDLGLSAFVDVGRGWSGDLPFSRDIPWTSAVGGGFRLALPARSGTAFRIEWAWPTDGSSGAVFRVVKDRGRTSR